jgi:hypothetical protein
MVQKKLTSITARIIAVAVSLSIPFTATAAGSLYVEDSIAGLGLDISVSGAPASTDIDVIVLDPDGMSTRLPVHTDNKGSAQAVVKGTKTEKAGTYTVSVQHNREMIIPSTNVEVAPQSMDPWTSTIQAWTPYIEPDGYDEADITVTLLDQFGNPLAGRPVAVVSSRTEDLIEAATPQTGSDGVQHFTLTTDEPGVIQLRAVDLLSGNTIVESAELKADDGYGVGGPVTTRTTSRRPAFYSPAVDDQYSDDAESRQFYRAQISESFDVIDHFEIDAPAQMRPNEEAQKFTVRAVDRNDMTVENYVGTVIFTSTDPDASFPASYTFKERDLGEKSFPLALKFKNSGPQTFRVEDRNDGRITGETTITVGTGGGGTASKGIDVTSHVNDGYVSSLSILVEGQGPRFANLTVMGGIEDAFGTTDDNGAFSIPVELSPNQRDFTIRVRDDAGRNDSGQIHLTLDQDKPVIGTIQFAPENPEANDKVLVVVLSEPNLARVIVRIPDSVNGTVQEISLAENSTQPGSYQAFFNAPAPDFYQPAVVATDRAGNTEEVRTQLAVGSQSLPKVQNLTAIPKVDAVELRWDAIAGEATGYRIYIGDERGNFLYTLDTGRAVTKATVKGLTPGQTYVFAVSAQRGEMESAEKSDGVEAQALGFNLEITPENGALNIKWTSLTTELPLSSFILEYGAEEAKLTESRILNGELRDFTIRDLLNDVEYFVRITPVTVTGDKLDELAATGRGAPSGSGFKPSARDDIPFDVVTTPGGTLHPAPSTPSSGIPPFAWMTASALGALAVLYSLHRQRALRRNAAFLHAINANYHGIAR